MGQKSGPVKKPAEQIVKEIRRATRRQFSTEEKIRIVLSGLRGEDSIAELCRREGISRTSIIVGQRNFWRPAISAWPATRHEPQPRMRSRSCAERFCQLLRQVADTSRRGVRCCSFWGMKRNAVRGMSINGRQASVRAHGARLSPVPLR